MKLEDFEAFLGLKTAALIAGAVGGVVQLAVNPKLSVVGAITSIFAGAMCAGYLGPVINAGMVMWLGLPHQAEGALNFLIGLLGMQIVAKIYTGFDQLKGADLVDLILRIFKRKE